MTGKVFFVRHGETDMNRRECLQGHIDCELNEQGIKEAQHSARLFEKAGIGFERVYSSPLKRAVMTAGIISGGQQVISDRQMIEMKFGRYEGMPYSEIDEKMWAFIHDPENVAPPEGVEPVQALTKRTGEFLRRLMADDINGNVLVVTHGIALRSVLWNLSGEGERSRVWGLPIKNCIVYELVIENGEVKGLRQAHELCVTAESDTSKAF